MKKRKGLVLESTEQYIYLLTREGEYRKIPSKGRFYDVGSEIEIEDAAGFFKKNRLRLAALAASVLLVFGLFFALQSPPTPVSVLTPVAYLDLDINPSLAFSLDENGLVLEINPLNKDGDDVLASIGQGGKDLRGQTAQEALEKILDRCLEMHYFSPDQENVIFVSLAAPEGYPLSSLEIQMAVKDHLLHRELESYLKVSDFDLQDVKEARGNNVSMNAVQLQKEMAQRGLLEKEDPGATPGPPPAVQDLLRQVPAAEVLFKDGEFIGGNEKSKSNRDQATENNKKPEKNVPPVEVPVPPKEPPSKKPEGVPEPQGVPWGNEKRGGKPSPHPFKN